MCSNTASSYFHFTGKLFGVFAVMEDLAILLAAVIFNAGYAATRVGYNGTVFLISAGVLVGPMAVIAGA